MMVSEDGHPYAARGGGYGPYHRSFNEGRHIFSSGRSLVGAGGWGGWGLARPDYHERNQLLEQKNSLQEDIDNYFKKRPVKLSKWEEGEIAREWHRTKNPKKMKREAKQRQISRSMSQHERIRRDEVYALQDRYG